MRGVVRSVVSPVIKSPFRGLSSGSSGPNRTTQGLIYKTDFEDFSSWVNDGTFSKVADDALIAFDPLSVNFQRTIGGDDNQGVRNSVMIKEDSNLYHIYAGQDTTIAQEFTERWASSINGGKTWTKHGKLTSQVDGNSNAIVMSTPGWVMKESGYYYYFRVMQKSSTIDATYGFFTSGAYTGDIWRATSMSGPWTWLSDLPQFASSWANTSCLPGSIIKAGSLYYYFLQAGDSEGVENVGVATSSNINGTFTLDTTPVLTKAMLDNYYRPENPKVFYHPVLAKYILLCNTYNTVSGFELQNTIQITSNIADWSAASLRRFQSSLNSMETTNVVGIPCPIQTPDGNVLIGRNNFIPVIYDHDGIDFTPLYHYKRIISTVMMEPSRNALRFNGSASGTILKEIINSNFIAEFGIQYSTYTNGTTIGFIYRSDGGPNEYAISIVNGTGKILFFKMVGGSYSLIQTATASQLTILNMINRVKIVAIGTSHKIYLNGQLQINATDSSFSTGANIGFYGTNVVGDIRLLSIRSSDNVTVSGIPEGTEVELRADGGICALTALAQSNGIATLTLNHWPMESFYINGKNYPINGGIWGGDVFDGSKLSLVAPSKNTIISATALNQNVVITFDHSLYEVIAPDVSAFTLAGKTISSVSVSGAVVTVTVSVAYLYSDTITINYTRPQTNPLRSNPDSYYIDSFTGQAVTNNIPVPYVLDHFTDTNAVHLHSHTPDTGGSWASPDGLTISGNTLVAAASAAAVYDGVIDASHADVDVTVSLNIPNSMYYLRGIYVRYTDSTHWYAGFIQRNNGNPTVSLTRDSATVLAIITGLAHVTGVRTLRVKAVGQTITVYLDGVQQVQITNASDYLTITKCGIRAYRDANYVDVPVDDFQILAP